MGRAFLMLVIITSFAVGVVFAYSSLTARVAVEVKEPLSWVGSNEVSVSLYPRESKTVAFTLRNASSATVDADLDYIVVPALIDVDVSVPKKLSVPAVSTASFNVGITAGKSAPPGTCNVTISVSR